MSRTRKVRFIDRREVASALTSSLYPVSQVCTCASASAIESAERTGPALALISSCTAVSSSPVLSGVPAAARSEATSASERAPASTGAAAAANSSVPSGSSVRRAAMNCAARVAPT